MLRDIRPNASNVARRIASDRALREVIPASVVAKGGRHLLIPSTVMIRLLLFGLLVRSALSYCAQSTNVQNGLVKVDSSMTDSNWNAVLLCHKSSQNGLTFHIFDPSFELKFPKSGKRYSIYYKKFWKTKSNEFHLNLFPHLQNGLNQLNLAITCKEKIGMTVSSEYTLGEDIVWKDNFGISRNIVTTGVDAAITNCMDDTSMFFNDHRCHFGPAASAMPYLSYCTSVNEIYIGSGTPINHQLSNNLKSVNKLKISNSAMTTEEFDKMFGRLQDVWSAEVTNNKNLCVPRRLQQIVATTFTAWGNANGNSSTCMVKCTPDEAQFSLTCTIITGDIDVDCTKNAWSLDSPPGIGYNNVNLEGTKLTVRNCKINIINEYFVKVKNLKNVEMVVENPIGGVLEFKKLESNFPKIFKVITKDPVSRLDYAILKNRIETSEMSPKVEFPEGVCYFEGNATEVKGCKIIEGDLYLNENSKMVDPMLEEINGCLRIVTASLPNYDFLNNIKKANVTCAYNPRVYRLSKRPIPQLSTDVVATCIPYENRMNPLPELKEITRLDKYTNCTQERKKDEEEEGLSGGAIAGIVIAVLLIFLLAGAGGGIAAFIIIRKKKSTLNAERKNVQKNGPPARPANATPANTLKKGGSKPSKTVPSNASTDEISADKESCLERTPGGASPDSEAKIWAYKPRLVMPVHDKIFDDMNKYMAEEFEKFKKAGSSAKNRMFLEKRVTGYTDASSKNGKSGFGIWWAGKYQGLDSASYCLDDIQHSAIAEIKGIQEAITKFKLSGLDKKELLCCRTDFVEVITALKDTEGANLRNSSTYAYYYRELYNLASQCEKGFLIEKVKAHSDDVGNYCADLLADIGVNDGRCFAHPKVDPPGALHEVYNFASIAFGQTPPEAKLLLSVRRSAISICGVSKKTIRKDKRKRYY